MKQRLSPILMLLCLVIGSVLCPRVAFSHEFEPGHIERTIDVVIRDRALQIKYAIGLSDVTMLDWLVRDDEIEPASEQRFRRLIEDYESSKTASGETDAPLKPAETEVQPAQFQRELVAIFKEKLSEKILGNLELTCDDAAISFTEKQLTDTSRHHVVLEATLKATIPDDETVILRLADQNFLENMESKSPPEPVIPDASKAGAALTGSEQDILVDAENPIGSFRFHGKIRCACRVKGNAVLVNSNVAPVLARAKVTDVGQMNRKQRLSAATIETKLVFTKPELPQSPLADSQN